MAWTEEDNTNWSEIAVGDLPATPAQWVEIRKLSQKTWRADMTREQAADLLHILSGESFDIAEDDEDVIVAIADEYVDDYDLGDAA